MVFSKCKSIDNYQQKEKEKKRLWLVLIKFTGFKLITSSVIRF